MKKLSFYAGCWCSAKRLHRRRGRISEANNMKRYFDKFIIVIIIYINIIIIIMICVHKTAT